MRRDKSRDLFDSLNADQAATAILVPFTRRPPRPDEITRSAEDAEDRRPAEATVRLPRELPAAVFTPFKWATIAGRKGPREVLKNGFSWRISLPRRLRPLLLVLSAVFTPATDESLSLSLSRGEVAPGRRIGARWRRTMVLAAAR